MSVERDWKQSAVPERAQRSARPGPAAALPAGFYRRDAAEVARDLLGCRLVSEIGGRRCVGEIVETEAYVGPDDEASHAHLRFGRTARNDPMFGPAGHAYVYLIYGMHWCLNAVTGEEGFPAAVLIRALAPLEGLEVARERRPGRTDRDLMRGPGNVCRALAVDGAVNRHPLGAPPVWVEAGASLADASVQRGPRIGITRAAELPLRFWVRGSPFVSR